MTEPRRHPEDTPRIHQADRGGWQREAARELAAILDEHADLPAITWTISRDGGIAGGIDALALAPEARATFAAWQQALGLPDVAEDHADKGGKVAWLRARGDRGGARISVQAYLFTENTAAGTEKQPGRRDAHRPAYERPADRRPIEPPPAPRQASEGPRW